MEFRTTVNIERPGFQIEPLEKMLFVGSCFAGNIGRRFQEEKFRAVVNPYGVMYNPVSVMHTVERFCQEPSVSPRVAFITLGTNHVYRLKETGEIVDNCEKRPQQLFQEEQLGIDECVKALSRSVELLRALRHDVHIVFTVSPIRYKKYGFHESQLSKSILLLAVEKLIGMAKYDCLFYFPAYEVVLDELRDYRFYKEDMLHPSEQAVEYIWQLLVEHYFSLSAKTFLREWKPIKDALNHRPLHPDSPEYQLFLAETRRKETLLLARYT